MPSPDDLDSETLWNSRAVDFAHDLARNSVDYSDWPLSIFRMNSSINTLMTELWDAGFSQDEIRTAFKKALDDMPRYTGGHERNGVRTYSGKKF